MSSSCTPACRERSAKYAVNCGSVTIYLIFVRVELASGSARAAHGLGLLSAPFSFLSGAFVPVQSMPRAVQAFAKLQPLTFLANSWRGLLLGKPVETVPEKVFRR